MNYSGDFLSTRNYDTPFTDLEKTNIIKKLGYFAMKIVNLKKRITDPNDKLGMQEDKKIRMIADFIDFVDKSDSFEKMMYFLQFSSEYNDFKKFTNEYKEFTKFREQYSEFKNWQIKEMDKKNEERYFNAFEKITTSGTMINTNTNTNTNANTNTNTNTMINIRDKLPQLPQSPAKRENTHIASINDQLKDLFSNKTINTANTANTANTSNTSNTSNTTNNTNTDSKKDSDKNNDDKDNESVESNIVDYEDIDDEQYNRMIDTAYSEIYAKSDIASTVNCIRNFNMTLIGLSDEEDEEDEEDEYDEEDEGDEGNEGDEDGENLDGEDLDAIFESKATSRELE